MANLIEECDLLNASEDETVHLLRTYCEFNSLCDGIRRMHADLGYYTNEKIMQLVTEVFIASFVGDILKQTFKVFINPYKEAIDAVGELHVLQIKTVGGYSNNSRKFNMKKGVHVNDYVFKMEMASDAHRALFVVANLTTNQVCICPAFSFADDDSTFISWNKITKAEDAKVHEMPDPRDHFVQKAALLLKKAEILKV